MILKLLELTMTLKDFYWKTDVWLKKISSTLSSHLVLINPRVFRMLKYDITDHTHLYSAIYAFPLPSIILACRYLFLRETSWIAGVYSDESCWYDFNFVCVSRCDTCGNFVFFFSFFASSILLPLFSFFNYFFSFLS